MKPNAFVVIFKTVLNLENQETYNAYVAQMNTLVKKQEGYLSHLSFRNEDGLGLTLSYWENEKTIAHWKKHAAHQKAQQEGKEKFYINYTLEIAQIKRSYSFPYKGDINFMVKPR